MEPCRRGLTALSFSTQDALISLTNVTVGEKLAVLQEAGNGHAMCIKQGAEIVGHGGLYNSIDPISIRRTSLD